LHQFAEQRSSERHVAADMVSAPGDVCDGTKSDRKIYLLPHVTEAVRSYIFGVAQYLADFGQFSGGDPHEPGRTATD
jgi:hypothetical protein